MGGQDENRDPVTEEKRVSRKAFSKGRSSPMMEGRIRLTTENERMSLWP